MSLSRRTFLLSTAAIAASSGGALPRRLLARRPSANNEIRLAVIGFNSRGRDHISAFSKLPNVRIAALCDVDENVRRREAKALADRGNAGVFTCSDMRRIFDRTDIDAISTATPNHWHSLCGIWACESGKDAYVEKPVSHNVWEGRQLVAAARKHNRIVAAGTQARSSPAIREAIEWIRAGNLGRITLARGLCYKPRRSIGKVGPAEQPVPTGVDYDLWTGPAELRPLHRKKLHYDWHWDFNTGNGDLGNQGIHQMDICRWALGEPRLAPAVCSLGGRFGYDDDGETPNTQLVWFGYSTPLLFEVRGLPRDAAAQREKWEDSMDKHKGLAVGVVIECEGGLLTVGMDYERAVARDHSYNVIKEWKADSNHFENFINAVRSRKATDLSADVEEGHVSSALCHLGNISYRLGTPTHDLRSRIGDMPDAAPLAESYQRFAAHLASNDIDLDKTPARLGPSLEFDPAAERFTSSDSANALLRRPARPPFEVPQIG